MSGTTRVSISLPTDVVGDLDYISRRIGVSRSALIAQMLLTAELGHIRTLLTHVPEDPTESDLKRFRGDSKAYVKDQLQRLQSLQGDLLDDSTD